MKTQIDELDRMCAEANKDWITMMDAPLTPEQIASRESHGIFETGDPREATFWAEVEAGTRPDPRGIMRRIVENAPAVVAVLNEGAPIESYDDPRAQRILAYLRRDTLSSLGK
jgi:hypothetical protein